MNRARILLLALLALAAVPAAARAQTVPDSVLAVTRSGQSILRANVDGKVGIGTSTPDRKLTVNGTIAAADTIVSAVGFKFPDGSVQTTAAVSAGPASGTSANTPNTLVARDANGGFAAGKVTLDSLSVAGRSVLGRVVLDSLTAGKARLDSLSVTGHSVLGTLALDSLTAGKARLDSLVVTGSGIRFADGSTQSTSATGTSANTANALVQRDANGGFAAGKVTLDSLSAGGVSATRARLDSLAVIGTGIRFADGSLQTTAATSATGTSANTANTLVQRDAGGSFAASTVVLDSLTAGRARLDSLAVTGSGIRFADGSVQTTAATTATGTSVNTPSTLVARDANGAFAAGAVAATGLTVSDNQGDGVRLRIQSGSTLGDRVLIDSAGGFVAMGSLGIGLIPKEGAGERMMWHPYRSAFRAGSVSSTGANLWNDSNIGFYSIAGGLNAAAQDIYGVSFGGWTNSDGDAAIAIGFRATANANYAIALGRAVSANGNEGAIVIGDGSTSDSLMATAANQFSLRAAGGIRLFTNIAKTAGVLIQAYPGSASTPWTGCSSVQWVISASNCAYLSNAGAWTNVSDVNRKHGFAAVHGEDVLTRLRRMPITTWTYNADGDEVRHLGPTAQDFHAAFGLNGADETHITTIDGDGVALAAAQALDARTLKQAQTIAAQAARIATLERQAADQARTQAEETRAVRAENAELRARLDAIERMLRAQAAAAPAPKP